MRAAVVKVKNALRHPMFFGGVLIGSGIVFTAAPGSIADFMAAAGGLFALNVLFGNYRLREVTAGHLMTLGIVFALVLLSLSLPGTRVHGHSMRLLLLTPGMIMACHALAKQIENVPRETLTAIAAVVICLCVSLQVIGLKLYKPGAYFGFYENPHHLGLFASLVLPLMGYFLLRFSGWQRLLLLPWMTAALFLFWMSGSRVSWFVFFTTMPLVCLLFLPFKQFSRFILGASALTVLAAWLAGFSAIGARINDLYVNLSTEDRVLIWPATLEVIQHSTVGEWLFGRGVGSFRVGFGDYSTSVKLAREYAFPHNAVLQLLYENGLTGLILVFAGFCSLMWILWRLSRRFSDCGQRHQAMTLFALLCVEIGHCMLTKSIYSKYILYSLSLVVGASLVFIEKARVGSAEVLPVNNPEPGAFSK